MKKEKFYTEEQKEIYSFIKIIVGLLVVILIFYFLTSCVNKKTSLYKRTNNEGTVQYNYIYLGSLLNMGDKEYYVLAIDSKDVDNTFILNESSIYRSKDGNIPLYYADLSFELNSSFKGDESNYKADDVSNLKIKGTTLIKVKDHKIISFIEDVNEIEKILK